MSINRTEWSTIGIAWLSILTVCGVFGPQVGLAEDRLRPAVVGDVSTAFQAAVLRLDRAPDAHGTIAHAEWSEQNADFLRLRLFVSAAQALSDVKIVVADSAGVMVDAIDLRGVRGAREYWTHVIPGWQFSIRVVGVPQAPGAVVTLWQLIRSVTPPQSLSIIDRDDRESWATVTQPNVRAAGRAVAKLLFQNGPQTYSCTGFLIGRSRMMTNQHCIATDDSCASAVVLFDYDTANMVPVSHQRRCLALRRVDQELDYSVFDLDEPAEAAIQPLAFAAQSAAGGEALMIIEHPGGEPKQISRQVCRGVKNPVSGNGMDTDFTHSCATLGGSSGSPVLNSALRVVGLHHFGVGGDELKYNRAVRVEPIVQGLHVAGLYP